MGYPEDYGLIDGGGTNAAAGGGGSEGGEACVPFEVTIVADHWPKETSWVIEDTQVGDIVAEGTNDDLKPGEPVKFLECVNNRGGCYEFTIHGEIFISAEVYDRLIISTSIFIDIFTIIR